MGYVSPSGTIELMRGVNLDNRYMHTLYFDSPASRDNYFASLVTNTFTNQMYTRVNEGIIKVRAFCEDINNVTYLRFKNRPTGRYYYAFVNGVEYINENVSMIKYEIDVMQTWFFGGSANINPCMVKREHVAVNDDKLKLHLEPEPVSTDVYRFDDITPQSAGSFGGYDVVVNTSNEATTGSNIKDGIFCGTEYWSNQLFDEPDDVPEENIQTILYHMKQAMGGSWDKNEQSAEITDLYMFPHKYKELPRETYFVKMIGDNNTYHPQNNKLYSYPYCFLYATTKGGSNAEYRWEYFDSDMTLASSSAEFQVYANGTGGGSVLCYPKEYNGIEENIDASLVCDSFPKCSWAYDAYEAFVAAGGQTKLNESQRLLNLKGMIVNTSRDVQDVAGVVAQGGKAYTSYEVTAATGGITAGYAVEQTAKLTGAIAGTTANIAERHIGQKEAQNKIDYAFNDARYAPDIVVGKQTPNIAVGQGFLGFYFYNCHVDPMEMVRIDNFFTVYGYAINTVKKPNLTGRPFWNFVQTDGAQITGDMPASSKEAIARIFDGGIFFWNPARGNQNIGNFKQSYNTTSFGEQIKNR